MLLKIGLAICLLGIALFLGSAGVDALAHCRWQGVAECGDKFVSIIVNMGALGPLLVIFVGLPLIFLHYLVFFLKAFGRKKL